MSATPGELAERPHTKDESVDVEWRYLLVSESDVETAKGSWGALKLLGM